MRLVRTRDALAYGKLEPSMRGTGHSSVWRSTYASAQCVRLQLPTQSLSLPPHAYRATTVAGAHMAGAHVAAARADRRRPVGIWLGARRLAALLCQPHTWHRG